MRTFRVVAFETLYLLWSDRYLRKGGGVAFLPDQGDQDWQSAIDRIVKKHFNHKLGRTVEIGVATLDETMIESACQKDDGVFWLGGDTI